MKTKFLSASILLSLLAFTSPLSAQWTQLNGPIVGTTVIPIWSDSTTLIVTTALNRLFRTTDGGDTWIPSYQIQGATIASLMTCGDTILVGTTDGRIHRSADRGITWNPLKQGFILQSTKSNIYYPNQGLAIHNSTYYAGIWGQGFTASTDNGTNWSLQCSGLYPEFMGFFAHRSFLYGVTPTALVRLGEGGRCMDIVLPSGPLIRAVGANDSLIFAGTSGGVKSSSDGGNSWDTRYPKLKDEGIISLAVDGANIYVWTIAYGLSTSSDGGVTWVDKRSDLPSNNLPKLLTHRGAVFAALEGYGFYRSTDEGFHWQEVNVGKVPLAFAQLFTAGSRVFGSTLRSGMWMSADSGVTWQQVLSDFAIGYFSQMFSIGSDIFGISEFTGTYRSQDGGMSWQPWNSGGLSPSDRNVSGSVVLGGTVFVGSRANGVLRSTNNAWSWTNVSSGLTDRSVVSLTAVGTTLFAGTARNGLFRSTDNGDSWTECVNGIPIKNVRSVAGYGKVVYAASEYGEIYYSTDLGDSWKSSLQPFAGWMFSSFIASGDYFFANRSSGPMFCSNTLGRKVSIAFPNRAISSMALLGKSLLVSTPDSGLFRYVLPLPPTAKSILPVQGSVLQTFFVTVGGTNFVPDLTSLSYGEGINVYSLVVESPTRLRATVTITGSASIGMRDAIVNVVPGGGSDTLRNALTIDYPAPRIMSSDRSLVLQGETVYIHLSGLNFLSGLTKVQFGDGINVISCRADGPGQISATIFVLPGAAVGPRDITVTNPQPGGGTSTLRGAFKVLESSGLEVASAPRPTEYRLYNAYPNPFNPATRIEFDLPEPSRIEIEIYNSIGILVERIDGHNDYASRYAVNWNADGNPSGVYLIRLSATSRLSGRSFQASQKVILLR